MGNSSSRLKWRLATAVFVVLLITSGSQMAFVPQGAPEGNFFKGPARAWAFAEAARLRQIQQRYLDRIMAEPGVHGTGIGLDRETGRLVFDVMVDPEASEPRLPSAIEGVRVRIRRQSRGRLLNGGGTEANPSHANKLPLPVQMGNSGNDTSCGSCTLGFKACDIDTGNFVYVTNAHCSTGNPPNCAGTALAGSPTYHPSLGEDLFCQWQNSSLIGSTAKNKPPSNVQPLVDATSVNSDETLTQFSIRDIGTPSQFPGSVVPGDLVQKSGRSTGWTQGEVSNIGYALWVSDPVYCSAPILMQSQIRVDSLLSPFCDNGDSGSAVLDVPEGPGVSPAVVGLLFYGFSNGDSVANQITPVLGYLDLSLRTLDCQLACAASLAAPSTQGSSERRATLGTIRRFRDDVLQHSERGRDYIRLYYRFTVDIVKLMLTHPMLLAQTTRLLERTLPVIEAVTAGRDVTVTPEQIAAVDTLFSRYAEVSSDLELQSALTRFRRDLHDPEVLREFGVRVQ